MGGNDAKPFFLAENEGFGQADPKDELLHPERNKLVTADSLSETQCFGFSIPEEKVHTICYLWHHPNLGVVSGGLLVWLDITCSLVASCLWQPWYNLNNQVSLVRMAISRKPTGAII